MNGVGLKVTRVGYVEIDAREEVEEEPWRGAVVGRRSFGRFNRALEVCVYSSPFKKMRLFIATFLFVIQICEKLG